MSVAVILLIVAMICFLLGTINFSSPINLTALGLFFVTLYLLVGKA